MFSVSFKCKIKRKSSRNAIFTIKEKKNHIKTPTGKILKEEERRMEIKNKMQRFLKVKLL